MLLIVLLLLVFIYDTLINYEYLVISYEKAFFTEVDKMDRNSARTSKGINSHDDARSSDIEVSASSFSS